PGLRTCFASKMHFALHSKVIRWPSNSSAQPSLQRSTTSLRCKGLHDKVNSEHWRDKNSASPRGAAAVVPAFSNVPCRAYLDAAGVPWWALEEGPGSLRRKRVREAGDRGETLSWCVSS